MSPSSALPECTTPSARQNARSGPIPSRLCDTDDDGWRRPVCSDACTRSRVLVADGNWRGWRTIEAHDHTTYERGLEHMLWLLTAALIDRPSAAAQVVRTGPLVVDLLSTEVLVAGRAIHLSESERRLVLVLAWRAGIIVTRRSAAIALWPDLAGLTLSVADWHRLRMVTVRLRARLGAAAYLVETVPGIGLRLREATPWSG